jgi:hypothetical protein
MWNFSRIIKDIISCHHKPGACVAHSREAMVVHLADIMVKGIGVSFCGDPFVPPFDADGWSTLGLKEGDLVDIVVEVADIVQGDPSLSKYAPGGNGSF